MSLINKTNNGYEFNESDASEKYIIEKFEVMFREYGFDSLMVTCGVSPTPDFGYFELADRFWRSSLCIYMAGGARCFWESGIGYSEPWLFNARHSFELSFKGLLLFTIWHEEVENDSLKSGHKNRMQDLRGYFQNPHSLLDIYLTYKTKIDNVIKCWNRSICEEVPQMDSMLLSNDCEEILKELDESDNKSFRFRYPSL
jgi:hypothetical protein